MSMFDFIEDEAHFDELETFERIQCRPKQKSPYRRNPQQQRKTVRRQKETIDHDMDRLADRHEFPGKRPPNRFTLAESRFVMLVESTPAHLEAAMDEHTLQKLWKAAEEQDLYLIED